MTFDDFLHESQVGYSTIETKEDLHYVIKRTWNAALEAAWEELSDDRHWWNDTCHCGRIPVEKSLNHLKT